MLITVQLFKPWRGSATWSALPDRPKGIAAVDLPPLGSVALLAMQNEGASGEPAAEDVPPDSSTPRRSVREVAVALWHQQPGSRTPRPPRIPANAKQIADALDKTDRALATASGVTAIV